MIAKLHESVSNVRAAIEDDSNTLVEKKHALAVLEAQLQRTRKESSDTLHQALDAHRQASGSDRAQRTSDSLGDRA